MTEWLTIGTWCNERARAVGGAGLIIAEATAVEPRGRITPLDAVFGWINMWNRFTALINLFL